MVDNQYRDRKILVVDDEERMVRFIRLNLEHDGFQVIEAFNGNQAINKAPQQPARPGPAGCDDAGSGRF